ncbi:MAG: hypothetical protein ACLQG3_14510 [Terracidiphilus sp.]
MRPKKKILLVDSSEARRSVRAYALRLHNLTVRCAGTSDEAVRLVEELPLDLAIVCWPITKDGRGAWLDDLHRRFPHFRSMVLAEDSAKLPDGIMTDALLLGPECSTFNVVERVKVLSAHRRGPKRSLPPGYRDAELLALAQRRIA